MLSRLGKPGNNTGRSLVAGLVLSLSGLAFIQTWEGSESSAYLDSVGVPTICTGSTKAVKIGDTATPQECQERLRLDVSDAGKALARCVTAPVTQGQYDALLSLSFNIGGGAICRSTLVRKLNHGDCTGAAKEFLRWDRAGGSRLRGLTNRRKAESSNFIKDCDAALQHTAR